MRFFLGLFFLLLLSGVYAQKYTSYVFELSHINEMDYRDSSESSREVMSLFKNLNQQKSYFEYLGNDSIAVFRPLQKIDNSQGKLLGMDLSNAIVKSYGKYYLDFVQDIYQNEKSFSGKRYIINLEYDDQDWQFDVSDTLINGMLCKKAIRKIVEKDPISNSDSEYVITVWYTNQLDHSIKPFGMVNVPGSIVKINFNENINVELLKNEISSKKFDIGPFRKGIEVSSAEYDNIVIESIKKRYRYRNVGVDTSD